MYKSINLGLLASGTKLVGLLEHNVMYAGFDNGLFNYYYMRGNNLFRVRFTQSGRIHEHKHSNLGFNTVAGKSMSVAGNAALVPNNLSVKKSNTFNDAIENYTEIVCTDPLYTSICGEQAKKPVMLSEFLTKLTYNFTSDDIADILGSTNFETSISHEEFKKIIKGEK